MTINTAVSNNFVRATHFKDFSHNILTQNGQKIKDFLSHLICGPSLDEFKLIFYKVLFLTFLAFLGTSSRLIDLFR